MDALFLNAVDDVHLGVRFASLLRIHIKGLRQRFVQVETPTVLPSDSFFDTDFATRQGPSTTQLPLCSPQSPPGTYLIAPLLERVEVPATNHVSGGINDTTFAQDYSPEAGEGLPSSATDWFALPMDAPDDAAGNSFMQSFFEVGHSDERFFWDTSL